MAKNLVIVESPAKAKTIEGYLGKDFVVKSSFGHVRDLGKKQLGVEIENNFKPMYEVTADKKAVVKDLKKLADKAEIVWLATDEDREGEAISWHLQEALELSESKTKRITFNEITKTAVTKAIESPRNINKGLVDAQQARRVLDRLVGFELSPVLWKKVKPSLSAGRVQSVAVRLIVEKEKDIRAFTPESSYKVSAIFKVGKAELKAGLAKKIKTQSEAEAFVENCKNAEFTIDNLVTKPAKKSPAAPFTTSTLQQEASRKLGYSVARTMQVAQKLYESGKITYMRTDSLNLSDLAMGMAKDEIVKSYGADFANPKKYVNKAKGAQEAHEAIRPADMSVHKAGKDSSEQRLYDLIWKRTLASQMADAQLEKTTATIGISTTDEKLVAHGEILKFEGFLKVYLEGTDDEDSEEQKGMLPPLKIGEKLDLQTLTATERFTHHPARFTEASLVKKLEELGIGRPSTYAPTISTIQKRQYVEKPEREGVKRNYNRIVLENNAVNTVIETENTGAEKNKLAPTDIGIVVSDFLVENFGKILDYSFTANVEKEFDDIAQGLMEWTAMIKKFYSPFHENVEDTLENSERASGERILGEHPESGKVVLVRIGRFGAMVQIGAQDDEEKPKYASLLKNQSISTITLEEALELFKLPREVGEYEGKKVSAAIGRFGPYIRFNSMFVSLKKAEGDDPMTVDIERAIELIEAKKKADAEKFINSFDDGAIQVLNGRWGPYIKIGKKNFKIPKDTDPKTLTKEQCIEISENPPAKKTKAKAKTKKKTTAKKK